MSLLCIKCEAPVVTVPGDAGFHCNACGTAFLDFGRVVPDRDFEIDSLLSESTPYRCPKDRGPLRRHRINGLEFERCPACRHLLLDQGELSILRRMAEARKPRRSDHPGKPGGFPGNLDAGNPADWAELFFQIIGAVTDW